MVDYFPHHLIVLTQQYTISKILSALPCEFCEASVCRILAARRTSEQWLSERATCAGQHGMITLLNIALLPYSLTTDGNSC